MTALYWILVLISGYLLGSLSFSIILSKLLGRDIRSYGSGNAGATNMTRVFGWGAGFGTLAFDILKATAAMLIGKKLLGETGLCIGGMAAITGHCWPVFHKFKGGKGIAVGAAIAIMIDWRVFLVVLVVFLIAALLSRKVSVGSLCAAFAVVPAVLVFTPRLPMIVLAGFAACVTIWRHRENIKRLIAGTEPDFRAGHGKRE